MAINFIAKRYYTFAELAHRWKCELNDIRQAVLDGDLVPSIHLPGGNYQVFQLDGTDDEDAYPTELSDWSSKTDSLDVMDWVYGFKYLIFPRRLSAVDCTFSFFSDRPLVCGIGDICFGLHEAIGIDELIKVGVFMADEVMRLEALQASDVPKPPVGDTLSTRERETLLKLVIGMAINGYGYDPAASKSTKPKEIADDLVALGIPITDDTVRKYLKLAQETVLPAKPRQS